MQLFKKKEDKKEEVLFKVDKTPEVVQLPEIKDKRNFEVRYPLIKPYAFVRIKWDESLKELTYNIEEPELDKKEIESFKILEDGIHEIINISFINMSSEEKVIEYLEKNLKLLMKEFKINLSNESIKKIMYYIYRNFVGLNRIEPIMQDYFIEDIECNGMQTPIYVVHRQYRNLRTNVVYPETNELTSFVEKLAQRCGQYVSYANPLLDGRLPDDNSRVNATYSQDVSSRGPTFTIRKFTREPWTPIKLMDVRTVSPEILAYLWILVEYGANIVVIGGTGSGKTSFLNSIAFFIPPAARIVSIEDTKELMLKHENWLPSVARTGVGLANLMGQKHGEVSLFDLLKESFRQRPDYVIVGEIRGQEAFVLFQGASSGHPSYCTMHAEGVDTMIRRLETKPINLSPSLIESVDAVCVMIQTKVGEKSVRRVREIAEIEKVEAGKAVTNVPFVRDPRKDTFYFKTDSIVLDKLAKQHGKTKEEMYGEFTNRVKLLMVMYKSKIFGFKEVQDVIHLYYKSKEEVLKRFKIK